MTGTPETQLCSLVPEQVRVHQHASEDTLRLLSEEAVMSEVCDASSVLHVKVVMAVICWEWPRSSCSLSPV